MGSVDHPFNPLSIVIGAEASFVARAIDTDKKELTDVLRAAAEHKGTAFVEVLQNCNIYNDGAFDFVREDKANRIYLRQGEDVRWADKGIRLAPDGSAEVVPADEGPLLVHDATREEPSVAFALSRLTWQTIGAVPMGIFRRVERPTYDGAVAEQIAAAKASRGEGDLHELLHAGDTWVIS
jgi:2-oxoglutarate ferredoxin oxidoreductase subunit beta